MRFGKQNETAEPSRRMKRIPSEIIYFPITLYKSPRNITVTSYRTSKQRRGASDYSVIQKEIIPCRIDDIPGNPKTVKKLELKLKNRQNEIVFNAVSIVLEKQK